MTNGTRSIDPNLGLLHNTVAYILVIMELNHLRCTTYNGLGFMKHNSLPSHRFAYLCLGYVKMY